jgi:hypothetical protein
VSALPAIALVAALSAPGAPGVAPACQRPLSSMATLAAPLDLAREAVRVAGEAEEALPGRPSGALREAARALADEAEAGDSPRLARESAAFRSLLAGQCAAAARPRLPLPSLADRQALREIYERPELRRARVDTAGFRRLLTGLWARLVELLGATEAERYASLGRMVFIVAGLAAALAGAAALRRRRARSHLEPAPVPEAKGQLPPPDRSAALAETALARGDLAGAVRHAFLSALAALEDARWLPRERSLTNGELASRLPLREPPLAEDFSRLGALFDGAIYGGGPVGEQDARAGLAAAARIRERTAGPR